jgi:hypothetical protein
MVSPSPHRGAALLGQRFQVQSLKHISPLVVASIFFLLTAAGCNEPFSPKGPFEQKLVAYSILTPTSNVQYVRLYLNYNPPGFDPYAVTTEPYDTTAQVTVTGSGQTFMFHDTLLSPTLRAFVNSSFRPQAGIEYTLTAVSQHGTISATSSVPASGSLFIPNQSVLLYPTMFSDQSTDVHAGLSSQTRGFLVRFTLIFSLESDTTFKGQIEIPLSYGQDSAGIALPEYPQLQRMVDQRPIISFPVTNYLNTIATLTAEYQTRIILKEARFYLVQADANAYNYYNVVNGFRDQYSIRTDQPDFTNIQNGLGVFGSFNVDSLVIHLF